MLIRAMKSAVLAGLVAVSFMLWSLFLSADAADRPEILVRAGDHGSFSRVVFDFTETPDYSVRNTGNGFIISFPLELGFDFAQVVERDLAYISNPKALEMEGGSAAAFDAVAEHEMRHFVDNNNVVVDIYYRQPETSAEPEEVVPEPEEVVPEPEEVVPETVVNAGGEDPAENETAGGNDGEDDGTGPEAAMETEGEAPAEVENDLDDPAVTAEPAAAVITEPVTTDPVSEKPLSAVPVLSLQAGAGEDAVSLRFSWPYPVSAAVFERSGTLWVVFDEEARFDLGLVQPYLNEVLQGAEQENGEGYVALRFPLKEGFQPRVQKEGDAWIITLSSSDYTLLNPVPIARQENAADGGQLFAPLARPGLLLDLKDPRIGDRLDILPVGTAGTGTAEQRRFAEFAILKSAQGIVLSRFSDQVVLTRYSNGMAIASLRRLAVSEAQLQNAFGDSGEEDLLTPARLIDFEGWRLGDVNSYNQSRHQLMRNITLAEGPEVNLKRWDLARFYLGHGLNVETMAVLDLMEESDPLIIKDPRFRAIRGLALIEKGEDGEAYRLLDTPELDAETDIYLWRALAAEAEGDYETAIEAYITGRDALDYYSPDDIARFRLAAVRAALASENYDVANWELSLVTTANVSSAHVHEGEYLQGRLLEALGETDEAMAYYRAAEAGNARRPAAFASYNRIMSELTREVISRADAIAGLERLHFSWGGDDFELKLLGTLGRLHLQEGHYRVALESLKHAVTSYPENPETRKLATLMSDIFRSLFLEGEADRIAPVPALAIYYDFRELTPLGADGDLLIRRLADRLVRVDLLKQAAGLLDHQVRFRLEGAAQAIVAMRLAKIYLLDRRPEAALDILIATRQGHMPSDVARERVLVEARVLTQLARYEEAEVILDEFQGRDVDILLSDIFWGAQNWPALAKISATLLRNRWQEDKPLEALERQDLIRLVIALAMTGQGGQLTAIRSQYGTLMQEGRFSNAFYVMTGAQDFSSDEFMEIVRQTAAVESLESFMDSYRAEFANADTGADAGNPTNNAP